LPVPSRTSRTHCIAESEASGRQASLEGGKTRNQVTPTRRVGTASFRSWVFYQKGFFLRFYQDSNVFSIA